ncbi:MAG: tetraacyldisaccharide 4'-kinase [Acidobacteria bacterium]|nr:tetraacyldisaccharide 4'-kinase [Acidobacteriota bacterium]
MEKIRVLIMGAAGRDFHNFNMMFRNNPQYHVVAFTATQIPNIDKRIYPPQLAGDLYPQGISIYPEESLTELIQRNQVDQVIFSYSDVSHAAVMHKASEVIAAGADFRLAGTRATMLKANVPVISVCAVRTGCGKGVVTQKISRCLRAHGKKVAVLRHPMPYGDLIKQQAQRFATLEDLKNAGCTIEEMEEYEPHIVNGVAVFSGIDYGQILAAAEKEVEVIVWDGGNNDLPFLRPDLEIVLVDPHRPGHETRYHPGEANIRRAHVIIIPKIDTAVQANVTQVREAIHRINPQAQVIEASLPFQVDDAAAVRGRRVLVIEEGPTLTHGEMGYGAGVLAARRFGAVELVDPRPFAVGSLLDTYQKYPAIGPLLPSMGYGAAQISDLEATINATPCDLVLVATPMDLRRVITIKHPTCRVTYKFEEIGKPTLEDALARFF